jgi:NAD(P)-dependent dehydrogenase (short-subunit alcohol dehydrogenase family)
MAEEIAVVTGAASGMGAAAAEILAEAGWTVLLCDKNQTGLEETKARLKHSAEILLGDISDRAYGGDFLDALAGRKIGALIHCAGISGSMADAARILEVNLAATMRLVETIRTHMTKGGCAVLFSSSGAHIFGAARDERLNEITTPEAVSQLLPLAADSSAAYALSKRAVRLLVERMAPSFSAAGARIISISPGIIDTPMGRAEMKAAPIMHELVAKSPAGRAGKPREVAAVAVLLCGPAASFLTGVDILVDGGMVATTVGAARGAFTLTNRPSPAG